METHRKARRISASIYLLCEIHNDVDHKDQHKEADRNELCPTSKERIHGTRLILGKERIRAAGNRAEALLMAFLQQDALHLSDLFRHSAQQMGVTAGLTLPIFDSGRLNANLDIAKAESNLSIASYNKAVVEAVNDVARAASQVQTLAEKNQHQAQIERDALRVVGLAQARFNAGIIAGSRVSEARIPALRERANGLLLQGQWLDASIQLTGALGGGYKR